MVRISCLGLSEKRSVYAKKVKRKNKVTGNIL